MIDQKLKEAITKDEIDECRSKLYIGMPVRIEQKKHPPLLEKLFADTFVETIYPHIITFEGGHSCTNAELVQYFRNGKSKPLCTSYCKEIGEK